MQTQPALPPDVFDFRHRFMDRKKLYGNRDMVKRLAEQIRSALANNNNKELRGLVDQYYPPDLADAMAFLNDEEDLKLFSVLNVEEAADLLDEVDDCTKELLARNTPPGRLAQIVHALPADEGVDILEYLPAKAIEPVLNILSPDEAKSLRFLLTFPKQSAGGMMSLGFTQIQETASVEDALTAFKITHDGESIFSIYVVGETGALQGVVDLRTLIASDPLTPVRELMTRGTVWTYPDTDQEEVARIFALYDLNSLPVISREPDSRLIGVITADDVIDVIEQEATEDILRMAGSDAQEMERTSPSRIALRRLPWIMATMFIELLAGVVIHFYDATLAKVLLLTSFMPIISAISGNTGLQSATIIVRGISAGTIQVTEWHRAVLRQLTMTAILGSVTGLTLGVIGAIWFGKWTFGLVIFLGMFAAVNIAGVVGTLVPLTSKRLGFDPAITSGPFETAFQDVIGISIFLTLATLMLPYLTK